MWTDQAMMNLSSNKIYTRSELTKIFQAVNPGLTKSTFQWTLYNLQKTQKIFRKAYDEYVTVQPAAKQSYRPLYSDKALSLSKNISERFLEIGFVVFESVLLNEFLNHQIAQNTIYIQVEKNYSSYIFDILKDEYPGRVLFKPGKKEFERYWTKDCLVVLELTSQAPMNPDAQHEIRLEKLLVDILADKSIAATFSPSELPQIFENVMQSYRIDQHCIKRYAGRRGKTATIEAYIGNEGYGNLDRY